MRRQGDVGWRTSGQPGRVVCLEGYSYDSEASSNRVDYCTPESVWQTWSVSPCQLLWSLSSDALGSGKTRKLIMDGGLGHSPGKPMLAMHSPTLIRSDLYKTARRLSSAPCEAGAQ